MLLIIMPVCLVILFLAMQKIEQSRQIEELSGIVEKKELRISSPVFGTIKSFPAEEGTVVKKNQIIAVIDIINEIDTSRLSTEIYSYDEDAQTISIKSPTDAVIFTKELAEKSSIKPQENILTLHPLTHTVIKIKVNSEKDLKSFEGLTLTDDENIFHYPLILSNRMPETDKDGNTFYYATLQYPEFSHKLYKNQKVVIEVQRAEKALTGKIETVLGNFTKELTSTITQYL